MISMARMELTKKLSPSDTALLVIDIQNDFCSPKGLLAARGKDVSGMDSMIEQLIRLVSMCEQAGIPAFYTQQLYDRSHLNNLQKEQYDLDGKLITCDINGDGYKFYAINPPPDRVFPKYNYNIFSNNELRRELEASGVKTLIVTGVSTQICVETAIRNGFDLGYKIVVPRDLVATTASDPEIQTRTLSLVEKTYGVVVDSSDILKILQTVS
jgi:ureidoacrylate peracid hydrolase